MSTDADFLPATSNQALPGDASQLQDLVKQLRSRETQLAAALAESSQTVAAQQQLLDKLTHELALLKRCMFGSRRERFGADDPRQQTLFEVSDAPAGEEPEEDSTEGKTGDEAPRRQRRGHGRKPLPQY